MWAQQNARLISLHKKLKSGERDKRGMVLCRRLTKTARMADYVFRRQADHRLNMFR